MGYLDQNGIDIEMRDTMRQPDAYRELVQRGGRGMVPCLKITRDDSPDEWMYESRDIISYFAKTI